jgi:hypothetical protein
VVVKEDDGRNGRALADEQKIVEGLLRFACLVLEKYERDGLEGARGWRESGVWRVWELLAGACVQGWFECLSRACEAGTLLLGCINLVVDSDAFSFAL